MQKMVDEVRGKGAQVVVLLSHNGMDVDLKLATRVRGIDAILGGHTHDGVPQPTLVKQRRWHDAGHQRRQQRQVSCGARFRRARAARSADYRYKLLPVFANLLPADAAMAAYIKQVRAPYEARLIGKTRGHRRVAVSPRQFQRHV